MYPLQLVVHYDSIVGANRISHRCRLNGENDQRRAHLSVRPVLYDKE